MVADPGTARVSQVRQKLIEPGCAGDYGKYDFCPEDLCHQDRSFILTRNPSPSAASHPSSGRLDFLTWGCSRRTDTILPEVDVPSGRSSRILHVPPIERSGRQTLGGTGTRRCSTIRRSGAATPRNGQTRLVRREHTPRCWQSG